jgi:predicted amidohydrolase
MCLQGSTVTVVDTPFGRIGVGICYDLRFAEYALIAAQSQGARMLIYPGAFNTVTGPLYWELLQRARAVGTSFRHRFGSAAPDLTCPPLHCVVARGRAVQTVRCTC